MMSFKSIRRLAGNVVSLLASDVTNRVATFLIYAMVGRYLGAFEFGQMSLGLTFFQTFQLLAIAGIQNLVTREIAKNKAKTGMYFVNSNILVSLFSLLAIGLLLSLAWILNYNADTTSVILLMSLGLLPYALSVICDAVFQGWERMQYITYANLSMNVFKLVLAFLLLSSGYGLKAIIIMFFFSQVVSLLVKWWLLSRYLIRPKAKINIRFCAALTTSTFTFLGIDGLVAVLSSYITILLSKLAGETEVGLFSAASQLIVPLTLIIQSIALGFFPMMCQKYDTSIHSLKWISERLLELLLAVILPLVVGLYFLAESILLLIYGNSDFGSAAILLRIMVWASILRLFTQVLGRVLVASMREKKTLRILFIDVVAALIIGPILISQLGLIGAAITALCIRFIDFIQHYIPVSRLFSQIALVEISWKPIYAATIMALYLFLVKDVNLVLVIISAGALYAIVLSVLTIYSLGGLRQLKAKYLYLWSQ